MRTGYSGCRAVVCWLSVFVVCGSTMALGGAQSQVAEPQLSVGVASFEGGGTPPGSRIAEILAQRLAGRSGVRVVTPDELGEPLNPQAEPRVVRRVAFAQGLDAIVVGRVDATPQAPLDAGWSGRAIEVMVRSGHSGGTAESHRVVFQNESELERVAEGLAVSIVTGLGWLPPETEPPAVSTRSPEAEGGERTPLFAFGTANKDDPIEIVSEELEFVSLEGGGRRLVFTRNVRVVQGDVTLLTDELEALYAAQQSQPDELIAKGHVQVNQGDQQARCQQATYRRSDQMLSCSGQAELISGCDIVRGDSIEFDLQRDSARVVGAASVMIRPKSGESPDGCRQGGG